MKVALDVSSVPVQVAGAGRYVRELARRLPARGVETTLVSRRGDAARWSACSPGSTVAPLVPDARLARLVFEVLWLGSSTPARRADVWHGPHYTMPHRVSTPVVVTIHDLTFFTNPEWHEGAKVVFFRRAIAYAARHAAVLVSVSDFTARQIDELLPGHAPVVVAPHGVDLARFSRDESGDDELWGSHGLSDVPFVLFVGTLEPRKGLEVLLEAFGHLADDDREVELWIVGQAGWGTGNVERAFGTHRARARIRRLGFVDEALLPALFRRARVVAYPSRGEGFGLPVLEAMACGARVVTSANTVMAEVGADAVALVEVGDALALAGALAGSLARDAVQRDLDSNAARARAELFTWDASLEQHEHAYALALEST